MRLRTWYRIGLLGSGTMWLMLELLAAFDGDPATEPLTELVVGFLPWWVTIPLVMILAMWIGPHFIEAYAKRRERRTDVR